MVGRDASQGNREAIIEGEGQKQGQLHGENAKQEENSKRVDFI